MNQLSRKSFIHSFNNSILTIIKRDYNTCYIFDLFWTESFGKSKEKEECEKSCQEPCHHTDYEIFLSYAGLQRNVFIKKLNAALNDTENFPGFENFLNISYSEKKQYIE